MIPKYPITNHEGNQKAFHSDLDGQNTIRNKYLAASKRRPNWGLFPISIFL
jgi:hypothetical protein